jgi:hypothetical protein
MIIDLLMIKDRARSRRVRNHPLLSIQIALSWFYQLCSIKLLISQDCHSIIDPLLNNLKTSRLSNGRLECRVNLFSNSRLLYLYPCGPWQINYYSLFLWKLFKFYLRIKFFLSFFLLYPILLYYSH